MFIENTVEETNSLIKSFDSINLWTINNVLFHHLSPFSQKYNKSTCLLFSEVSDVYIYAGAAAGGTMTLALIITVIIVVCHKNKRTTKKQKANVGIMYNSTYAKFILLDSDFIDGNKMYSMT